MSYIDLIKAFEKWLETNYLPSSSQLLWYKLIYLFNKCGWSEWITVDNRRLMCSMQIESEKTFIRCRDKLIEGKFFEYRKGKKGCPNQYKINTVNFTVQMTVETTVNMTVKKGVETTDINRLKNNKKENKKEEWKPSFDELIENYTNNESLRKELKNHLAIRKKNGSLTNRSIELGFENLNSLTKGYTNGEAENRKIEIVRQSIANGWGGFFEIKDKAKKDIKKESKYDKVCSDLDGLYDN